MSATAEPTPIDVRHLGNEHVICCWRIGDVLVDPGPASSLPTVLAALGDDRPRVIALTHIHLDHAGATGTLVRRWPDLEVWVHERGARHLADPTKLLASAGRLYGAEMERLWGEILPVPEANLRVLSGGETVEDFTVAYTPGHASHHVSYLHEASGTAFVGDVCGVRIVPSDVVLPPTPPPDIDVELWQASLDLVAGWRPRRLALTHFGAVERPEPHIEALRRRLVDHAALARTLPQDAFAAEVRRRLLADAPGEAAVERYVQASPLDQLWLGLDRYWRKRDEAAAGA